MTTWVRFIALPYLPVSCAPTPLYYLLASSLTCLPPLPASLTPTHTCLALSLNSLPHFVALADTLVCFLAFFCLHSFLHVLPASLISITCYIMSLPMPQPNCFPPLPLIPVHLRDCLIPYLPIFQPSLPASPTPTHTCLSLFFPRPFSLPR